MAHWLKAAEGMIQFFHCPSSFPEVISILFWTEKNLNVLGSKWGNTFIFRSTQYTVQVRECWLLTNDGDIAVI